MVQNTAQVIKAMISSAEEAELGTFFINAKQAAPMHQILIELGHHQLPTPIQTDNLKAYGIIKNDNSKWVMKAKDIQFHWLHIQDQQQQFRFYWQLGKKNYADYSTNTCKQFF